jgi:hypothetical protein
MSSIAISQQSYDNCFYRSTQENPIIVNIMSMTTLTYEQKDELIQLYKTFKIQISQFEDVLESYPYDSELMRELRVFTGNVLKKSWDILNEYDIDVLVSLYKICYFAPFQLNINFDGPLCKSLGLGVKFDTMMTLL